MPWNIVSPRIPECLRVSSSDPESSASCTRSSTVDNDNRKRRAPYQHLKIIKSATLRITLILSELSPLEAAMELKNVHKIHKDVRRYIKIRNTSSIFIEHLLDGRNICLGTNLSSIWKSSWKFGILFGWQISRCGRSGWQISECGFCQYRLIRIT